MTKEYKYFVSYMGKRAVDGAIMFGNESVYAPAITSFEVVGNLQIAIADKNKMSECFIINFQKFEDAEPELFESKVSIRFADL